MKLRSGQALVLLVAGMLAGWTLARATGEGAADDSGGTTVAVVGGVALTRADVEKDAPLDFLQLARQEYQITEAHLERAIEIKLIELEAEAEGLTPAELIKRDVDDQVVEASDEEVSNFYDDRQLETRASREVLEPQIRDYLNGQARDRLYATFVERLRERFPAEIRLEPPRAEVASEGFPTKGPAEAPVTIVEFADFQCPYCFQILRTLDQVEMAYGDRVRLVYRQFPIPSIHPAAQKAAEASLCARNQGAFWEMHDGMFANQNALAVDNLKSLAGRIGLDRERFDQCLDSGETTAEIEADLEAVEALGLTGTPALFINGRFLNGMQQFDDMAKVIDDELRRAGYELDGPTEAPRPTVLAEGFPAKGPADAPVTIVEFADFQCPFCLQLTGALDRVLEVYEGNVRLVYRQFPLSAIHPNAQKAAEASLCADQQGKFWEMHDELYTDQLALDVASMKETARSLGLDGQRFDTCLDSGEFVAEIAADLSAGRELGVTGTPALFINGLFLSGVQDFPTLATIVEEELRKAAR